MQVTTVNVVLTVFVGEVVAAGPNPVNVIVAPTEKGATIFDANVRVAVPAATTNPVAIILVEVVAEICGVLHTYDVPP